MAQQWFSSQTQHPDSEANQQQGGGEDGAPCSCRRVSYSQAKSNNPPQTCRVEMPFLNKLLH